MNGSAVKARNRELRRVMGPEAIGVVNSHAESITSLLQVITQLTQKYDAALTRLERADTESERRHNEATQVIQELFIRRQVRERTFWGRLRWLVLGVKDPRTRYAVGWPAHTATTTQEKVR